MEARARACPQDRPFRRHGLRKRRRRRRLSTPERRRHARPAAPAPARPFPRRFKIHGEAGRLGLSPSAVVRRLLPLLLLLRRCPASWAGERPSPPWSPARTRTPPPLGSRAASTALSARGRRSKVCLAPQRQGRAGGAGSQSHDFGIGHLDGFASAKKRPAMAAAAASEWAPPNETVGADGAACSRCLSFW